MARPSILLSLPVLIALVLLALVAPASARVIWRGDFATGDLSQWTKSQMVSPDRLQVVRDPEGKGRQALQVRVRSGDDPIGASGNRNELVYSGDEISEGTDRYYKWRTLWPESYSREDTWQLFTQWHHSGTGGSPPVEFFVRGEDVILRVNGKDVWKTPLERGRWREFVAHIKWSSNPDVGFVEVFYDGKLALAKTRAATLYKGQGAYLKQGLYRSDTVRNEQTLFHADMTVASSLDDVMPPRDAQTVLEEYAAAQQNQLEGGAAEGGDGALFVGEPGSGGCASPGAGTWLSLLALGGVLVASRVRRRTAPVTVEKESRRLR